MRAHSIVEGYTTAKGCDAIRFLSAPYEGMIFSYGAVSFDENYADDELHVVFEYDIHKEPDESYTEHEMRQCLGDFLMDLILDQLGDGEIVYSGGTGGTI